MKPIPSRRRRLSILALLLVGITALAPWMPGILAILRFPALCLVPGAAVLLLASPRIWRRPSRALAAALLGSAALSPAVLFLGLRLLGSPGRAVVAGSIFWAFFFAGAYILRRYYLPGRPRGSVIRNCRAYVREWSVLSAVALLVALPLLLNPELRVRSDAWTHIALVREVLRGDYPWHDPRFAGQPLRYFWFYNLWAAGFAARDGLALPWSLTMCNLAATLAYVAAIRAAAQAFFHRRALRVAAMVAAVAALNPFGLLAVPLRLATALIGRTQAGLSEAAAQLPFRGTAVMDTLTPYGTSFVAWIDKFLVITAFGMGMAGAVLVALLVWEAARAGRARAGTYATLALVFAATLLHHLVAAAFAGATLGAGLVLARLLRRSPLSWKATFGILGVFLGVLLCAAPYWSGIVLGGDSGAGADGYGVGLESLWIRTALTSIGPLALLLFLGRHGLRRTLRRGVVVFAAFVLVSLVLILAIRMPTVNENKMIILFFCMTAPFAAPGALRITQVVRSAAGVAWWAIVAAACAVPLLLWIGEFAEPSAVVTPQAAAACSWLRRETPSDAVLIEPLQRKFLLNRADRDMFVSDFTFVLQCGYPRREMEARAELVRRLYSGADATSTNLEVLERLGRPAYIYYDAATGAPRGLPPSFRRVFARDDVEIFAWDHR